MKPIFLVLASLLLVFPVFANDGAMAGVSGTPGNLQTTMLAGEHKTIRMVREHIEITVGRDEYTTDARFVFHNDGPATTVRMGFPESASGDVDVEGLRKKTAFLEFKTWVDGTRAKATRMLPATNADDFSFESFWVKTVRFARGQTRRVRVLYRSPLGGSVDGNSIYYDFTGGNWKGKVDESTLRVSFTYPGTYVFRFWQQEDKKDKPTRRDEKDGFYFRWRNWQAQSGFSLFFQRTLPNGLTRQHQPEYVSKPQIYPKGGTRTMVIKAGKNFDPWKGDTNWPPSAVLRDGRAFVQFRDLSFEMQEAWRKKNPNKPISEKAGLYVRGDLAIAPYYAKSNQIIAVEVGKKTAQIGERNITLPAAPFRAGGVLYVPLAAMVEALGGKVVVDTKTMNYYFDVPG